MAIEQPAPASVEQEGKKSASAESTPIISSLDRSTGPAPLPVDGCATELGLDASESAEEDASLREDQEVVEEVAVARELEKASKEQQAQPLVVEEAKELQSANVNVQLPVVVDKNGKPAGPRTPKKSPGKGSPRTLSVAVPKALAEKTPDKKSPKLTSAKSPQDKGLLTPESGKRTQDKAGTNGLIPDPAALDTTPSRRLARKTASEFSPRDPEKNVQERTPSKTASQADHKTPEKGVVNHRLGLAKVGAQQTPGDKASTPSPKGSKASSQQNTPEKSASQSSTPNKLTSGKLSPKTSLRIQSPTKKSGLSPRTPKTLKTRLFSAKGNGSAGNSPGSEDEPKTEGESPTKRSRVKLALVEAYMKDGDDALTPDSPNIGPTLLRLAKSYHATGEGPQKAREYARYAVKYFQSKAEGKASLDLVLSLHILAALHCRLGEYREAIPVLERSLTVPDLEQGLEHSLALFAGHMQLGDTYALTGNYHDAVQAYHEALRLQKEALGDSDPRFGETCRYVAEAHLQAMQFDEAEQLCEQVLRTHGSDNPPASVEQAADRRLMALICSEKGDYEKALEHLEMASATLLVSGEDAEAASVDNTIGDTYLALGRYDEAVSSYQKALTVLKSIKGESDPTIAAVYVSLAELYLKTGKSREAKSYGENALKIYGRNGVSIGQDDIAAGLTEVGAIYEAINEREQALHLLQKALLVLDTAPGQQSAAAGILAQMGVMYYDIGKHVEALNAFKSAIVKLRTGGERRKPLLGLVLNQMGLACVELYEIDDAAEIFEEAKAILEETCGPQHSDTLAVCTNLAGTYDALGRSDEAIKLLEYILQVKEESLGTVHPDLAEERAVLLDLLRAVGRSRSRKSNTLQELLDIAHEESRRFRELELAKQVSTTSS